MDRWEQDFDVYMASIEEKPASFVVDLAAAQHAPVESHPVLLTIRVPMLVPRADGLRDASEMDALGELEDQFVEALEEKIDAIYAGRVVHGGDTTMFLYVPEAHRAALDDLPSLTGDPPGEYQPAWAVDDDPEWSRYLEFLTPDPYSHQMIWNRRLIHVFTEKGDALHVPREIDHMAYFPDREHAEQGAAALAKAGFTVDDELDEPEEADGEWGVQFHRDDKLSDDRPDEFVAEILDIIIPLDGNYDGWGAEHREVT